MFPSSCELAFLIGYGVGCVIGGVVASYFYNKIINELEKANRVLFTEKDNLWNALLKAKGLKKDEDK